MTKNEVIKYAANRYLCELSRIKIDSTGHVTKDGTRTELHAAKIANYYIIYAL